MASKSLRMKLRMHFNSQRPNPAAEGKMSIAELKPGQRARIVEVHGSGAIRQRLLDMGLIPQTTIQMERVAPAGDPLWITVRGYHLSLRRREAGTVRVAHCE